MGAENDKCDPGLVNRFFDGEVDEAERVQVQGHLAGCTECRRLLADHRNLGDRLKSSLDQVLTDSERTLVENRVIAQVRKQNRQPWAGLHKLLVPKRLFALTAATGLLLFVLTFFFEPEAPSGPSAIVTSFQGEYSSVMIMETPETRNTIIWFDETT